MKKTIKFLSLILALIVIIPALVACGDEDEPAAQTETEKKIDFESIDNETEPAGTEQETEPVETEEETEAPETEVPETEAEPEGSSNVGLNALALAEKLIGTKFKFGAIGPDEFDNSGFIYYIFKESGVTVPRLARDMPAFGKAVARADIQPGDILVFANEIGGGPEFEGIYAGDGQFIASFNPDKPTQQVPIGNYWEARFITARRAG